MILRSFRAENFRNIAECTLGFTDGVNILYGENAQGKTNALEAVYLFARGRSFRTAEEKELVRFGAEGFRLSIGFCDSLGEEKMEYAAFGRERRRLKNGVKLARASEMVGHFRAVLFTPDDLGMVKGGPEERRAFLNIALSQCYPAYMKLYARYKTLLESRNAILRAAKRGDPYDRDELLAFSDGMAESAAGIRAHRAAYIRKLDAAAAPFLGDLSNGRESMRVLYDADLPDEIPDGKEAEDAYRRIFSSSLEREIGAGTSLHGVQRDDLSLLVNDRSARDYGSQGQQRSVVLALKLAEGEVVRQITGESPVFLFDDVLSELDELRRSYLLSAAKDRQILMTTCELSQDLLRSLGENITVYQVENGVYTLQKQADL